MARKMVDSGTVEQALKEPKGWRKKGNDGEEVLKLQYCLRRVVTPSSDSVELGEKFSPCLKGLQGRRNTGAELVAVEAEEWRGFPCKGWSWRSLETHEWILRTYKGRLGRQGDRRDAVRCFVFLIRIIVHFWTLFLPLWLSRGRNLVSSVP